MKLAGRGSPTSSYISTGGCELSRRSRRVVEGSSISCNCSIIETNCCRCAVETWMDISMWAPLPSIQLYEMEWMISFRAKGCPSFGHLFILEEYFVWVILLPLLFKPVMTCFSWGIFDIIGPNIWCLFLLCSSFMKISSFRKVSLLDHFNSVTRRSLR